MYVRSRPGTDLGVGDGLVRQKDSREGVHGAHHLVTADAVDRVECLGRHASFQRQLTQHVALLLRHQNIKLTRMAVTTGWILFLTPKQQQTH